MSGAARLDPYLRLRLGAGLALLQPGIDPVFLVLLSAGSGIALADHGLVVGASQGGMAAGALIAAMAPQLPRTTLRIAAAAGLIACLATVVADGLAALLLVRAVFGFSAGMLYAASLRGASASSPAHAMGTVLLFQLLFATLVAVALPEVARLAGPAAALLCLAAVPLANLLLLVPDPALPSRLPDVPTSDANPAPNAIDAAAAAVFLFVAASTMIWSYVGAQAVHAGLSNQIVGTGVALGSLAAAVAALAVARGAPWLPVPVSGLLSALAMAMPFVAASGAIAYVAAMIAFNVGATYAFARYSALAIARGHSAGATVAALQSFAMVLGPLAAAAVVGLGGFAGLAGTALVLLVAAVAALAIDAQRRSPRDGRPPGRDFRKMLQRTQPGLDANLTAVQYDVVSSLAGRSSGVPR